MKQKKKSAAKQLPDSQNPEVQPPSKFSDTLLQWIYRYDTILLFIVLYLAYNTIDGVGLMSGDTTPSSLLPIAFLTNHTVYLDFATAYVSNPDFSYAFHFVQGHFVSHFPIVTSVLVTPVYAISGILSTFVVTRHTEAIPYSSCQNLQPHLLQPLPEFSYTFQEKSCSPRELRSLLHSFLHLQPVPGLSAVRLSGNKGLSNCSLSH